MNFLAPGVVAGACALAANIASAAGYPVAGAFLSDPGTAQAVTMVATGLGALAAGILAGVKRKPAV